MGALVRLGGTSAFVAATVDLHRSVDTTRSVRSAAGSNHAPPSGERVSWLVRRAAAGDECAWEELVEKFDGLVRHIARSYRLSKADADDVSQITWLRLFENIDQLQVPAAVGAWLATTARRECLRQLQRTSRVIANGLIPDALSEQASDSPTLDAVLLTNERDAALRSALEQLPNRDRKLLRMLMADPTPSYAEMSTELRIPIGSIGHARARTPAAARGVDQPSVRPRSREPVQNRPSGARERGAVQAHG
jgi:RNA polymerase sigma factor (sigma-70 family)